MQYNHIVFKKLAQITKLTTTEKMLLSCLASFTEMGSEMSTCYPSVGKLANMCSCTNRTVQRALNRLTNSGLVNREYRAMKNGGQTSNLYTLKLDELSIQHAIEYFQTLTETPKFKIESQTESRKTVAEPALEPAESLDIMPVTKSSTVLKYTYTTTSTATNIHGKYAAFPEPPKIVPISLCRLIERSENAEDTKVMASTNGGFWMDEECLEMDRKRYRELNPFGATYELVRSRHPKWSEEDVCQLACSIELEKKKDEGFRPCEHSGKIHISSFLLPSSMLPTIPIEFEGRGVGESAQLPSYSGLDMPKSASTYWLTPNVPRQIYLKRTIRPNPELCEWKHIIFDQMPLICMNDERAKGAGVWAWRTIGAECIQNGSYVNPKYGVMNAGKIKQLINDSMYGEGPTKTVELERKEAFNLIKSWFCDEFYPALKQAQYTFQGAKDGGQLKNLVGYLFGTISFQGVEPSATRALELFQRIMEYGLNTKWKVDLLTLSTIAGQYNQYISGAIESFMYGQNLKFEQAMDVLEATHQTERRLGARKAYRSKNDYMTNFDANSLHFYEIQFLLATGLPLDYFYNAPYFHPYVLSQVKECFPLLKTVQAITDKPWLG